jgi:transposase
MSAKKSKFFDLLATEVAGGLSIRDASTKIGCGVSTGYNISCIPEFQIRVSTIRSEAVQNASGKLSRIASKAVDALEQILDSDDAKDRLNAVKIILTHLVPLAEHSELRDRLDRLEQCSAIKVAS